MDIYIVIIEDRVEFKEHGIVYALTDKYKNLNFETIKTNNKFKINITCRGPKSKHFFDFQTKFFSYTKKLYPLA